MEFLWPNCGIMAVKFCNFRTVLRKLQLFGKNSVKSTFLFTLLNKTNYKLISRNISFVRTVRTHSVSVLSREQKIRQNSCLAFSLVKTLLSRNFCQKWCVRLIAEIHSHAFWPKISWNQRFFWISELLRDDFTKNSMRETISYFFTHIPRLVICNYLPLWLKMQILMFLAYITHLFPMIKLHFFGPQIIHRILVSAV